MFVSSEAEFLVTRVTKCLRNVLNNNSILISSRNCHDCLARALTHIHANLLYVCTFVIVVSPSRASTQCIHWQYSSTRIYLSPFMSYARFRYTEKKRRTPLYWVAADCKWRHSTKVRPLLYDKCSTGSSDVFSFAAVTVYEFLRYVPSEMNRMRFWPLGGVAHPDEWPQFSVSASISCISNHTRS